MNSIDFKDSGYDRIVDMKRLSFIVNTLGAHIPANGAILDIGCGNGIISRYLGRYGYQVQGVDVSEKAIETARKLNAMPNVRFDVKSAEELKASERKYDAIICSEVLEHLQDPSSLLRVLYHCLNESGKLIITVPNGRGPREMLVTRPVIILRKADGIIWKIVKKLKHGLGYDGTTVQSDADNLDHVQFFSKEELKKLSTVNNFQIVCFKKSNFIEDVFPFSFLSRKSLAIQKLDCQLADLLPVEFTGGFLTVWEKSHFK